MTPKEKAQELVNKYDETLTYLESKSKAKQCALMVVDEIEEALTDYGRGDSLELQNMDSTFRYWWQVKQEIEKIQ